MSHIYMRAKTQTKTKAKSYPLQALVFVTLLLSPTAYGARTSPKLPNTPSVSADTWPMTSTFAALDPNLHKEAVSRVKYLDNGPHKKLAGNIGEVRASHDRSRPSVFKYPVPTMGQASYCIKHVKKTIENLHLDFNNDQLIDRACSKWGDTVAEYYDFMYWWKGVVASIDEVENSFGSMDDLVSMIVDAISVTRMDISDFVSRANFTRKIWAHNANAAIDTFKGIHDIKNAATVAGAVAMFFSPALLEVSMILPAITDIVARVMGEKKLGDLSGIFNGGINTAYFSEEGRKITGMINFVQTINGMNKAAGRWKYMGQVLTGYVKISAASNDTYTAADVHRDLARLEITGTEMDDYITNMFRATFNQREFFRGLVPAVVLDQVLFVADIYLLVHGSILLYDHGGVWRDDRRVKEAFDARIKENGKFMKGRFATREALESIVEQQKQFIKDYDTWKRAGFDNEHEPVISKDLMKDLNHENYKFSKEFEVVTVYDEIHEQHNGINEVIDDDEVIRDSGNIKEFKLKTNQDVYVDSLEIEVNADTLGLPKLKDALREHRALEFKPAKVYESVAHSNAIGKTMAGIAIGVAVLDEVVTFADVAALRNQVDEMVALEDRAMSDLTDLLNAWHV